MPNDPPLECMKFLWSKLKVLRDLSQFITGYCFNLVPNVLFESSVRSRWITLKHFWFKLPLWNKNYKPLNREGGEAMGYARSVKWRGPRTKHSRHSPTFSQFGLLKKMYLHSPRNGRVNGYHIFSLMLEENGPILSFAKTVNCIVTIWNWSGVSWSKRVFATDQFLKSCLFIKPDRWKCTSLLVHMSVTWSSFSWSLLGISSQNRVHYWWSTGI